MKSAIKCLYVLIVVFALSERNDEKVTLYTGEPLLLDTNVHSKFPKMLRRLRRCSRCFCLCRMRECTSLPFQRTDTTANVGNLSIGFSTQGLVSFRLQRTNAFLDFTLLCTRRPVLKGNTMRFRKQLDQLFFF